MGGGHGGGQREVLRRAAGHGIPVKNLLTAFKSLLKQIKSQLETDEEEIRNLMKLTWNPFKLLLETDEINPFEDIRVAGFSVTFGILRAVGFSMTF